MTMLNEEQIIEVLNHYLESEGYTIESWCKPTECGIDIVARSPQGRELRIEAKGETSSRISSNRAGKRFDSKQKSVHLGKAILKALLMMQEGVDVGIALPDTRGHADVVKQIWPSLKKLDVSVYLIAEDRTVRQFDT
ncbi:MAG: hypothetical protein ABIC95_02880 [archaeon]